MKKLWLILFVVILFGSSLNYFSSREEQQLENKHENESKTGEVWSGKITLTPEVSERYIKQVEDNMFCDTLQLGNVTYTYQEAGGQMVISNLNLSGIDSEEFSRLQQAISNNTVIDWDVGFLKSSCPGESYSSLFQLKDVEPYLENSTSVAVVNDMQAPPERLSDVHVSVLVFAEYGEYMVKLSRTLSVSEFLSDSAFTSCEDKINNQHEFRDCIRDKLVESEDELIEEANKLIKTFKV